ncbi:unnamed protein product [Rotaria sordida]|uniref:Reverse transcriptase domain-containing protein n=1 Tax=Rotaria sordida TaxID=392033 RepID=A0A819AS90_9BILA|nr:unnamed protein product [Rotaria sordida]
MIDRSLLSCVIRTIEYSTYASIVLFALSIQAISLTIDDNIDLNANDLHHISIDSELNLPDILSKILASILATNGQATAKVYVPRSIQRIKDTEKVAFVKSVDLEIPESRITEALKDVGLDVVDVIRLTNKVKSIPTKTIKIAFNDPQNRNTFIRTRLQVDSIHFEAKAAMQNTKPVQCYICLKYNHVAKYCKTKQQICARCGENHRIDQCTAATSDAMKCCNCKGSHLATSNECATYKEQEKRMHNLVNQYSSINKPTTTAPAKHDITEFPLLPIISQRQQEYLHNELFDEIINVLSNKMEKIIEETTSDLNATLHHMRSVKANARGRQLQELFKEGFIGGVDDDTPTFEKNDYEVKLDWLLGSQPLLSFTLNVETHPPIGTSCGHKPLTFDISIGAEPKPASPRMSFNFKAAKWSKFRSKLDQQLMLWNNDRHLDSALDVEEYTSFITNSILVATQEVIPLFKQTNTRPMISEVTKRTAAIEIENVLSRPFNLKSGTPQGSPLSPLLYIIYTADSMNGIPTHTEHGLFADDTALWTSGNTMTILNTSAYPAGLLRMSAGTLSIYLRMFLNNGLPVLRPQSIAAMRTIVGGGVIPSYDPQWSNKSMELPPSQEFGLSWYWETMKDGRRYIGHSGALPGMSHLMLVNEKNTLVNMNFIPPNTKLIAEALGDISQLPRDMQMAVTNKLHESFQPVPIPNHGDWLRYHEEKGQTLKAFEQTTSKAVPHSTFNTIYIQPVGSFNHPRAAPLNVIIQFARIFFAGCEVELLPTIDFSKDMKYRENHGIKQYRTDGFYNYLSQTRYFRDTSRELLCVAVTMTDIYPDESWNFVYGEARVKDGLGVYSFARLDPLFSESSQILLSVPLTKEERIVMLRRCIKILLHELGHLFGLNHCIYFICLMNGANNQIEMDRQTLYLCPVCLRKLYSTLYFDVRHMYENFVYLCEIYGLEEERLWYRKRLNCI